MAFAGDQILVAASAHMLKYFQKFMIWCRGTQTFQMNLPICNQAFINATAAKNQGTFIYYHPGGNWGDMYGYVHEARLEVLKFAAKIPKLTIVGGPQTMYYYNHSKQLADSEFINAHGDQKRVILTWRQESSYSKAKSLYAKGSTLLLSSDMAFVLGQLKPCRENEIDVVVQLRADEESTMGNNGNSTGSSMSVCEGVRAKGRTCRVIQWITPKIVEIKRGKDMSRFLKTCTQQAVGILSLGRVVVTDR